MLRLISDPQRSLDYRKDSAFPFGANPESPRMGLAADPAERFQQPRSRFAGCPPAGAPRLAASSLRTRSLPRPTPIPPEPCERRTKKNQVSPAIATSQIPLLWSHSMPTSAISGHRFTKRDGDPRTCLRRADRAHFFD